MIKFLINNLGSIKLSNKIYENYPLLVIALIQFVGFALSIIFIIIFLSYNNNYIFIFSFLISIMATCNRAIGIIYQIPGAPNQFNAPGFIFSFIINSFLTNLVVLYILNLLLLSFFDTNITYYSFIFLYTFIYFKLIYDFLGSVNRNTERYVSGHSHR